MCIRDKGLPATAKVSVRCNISSPSFGIEKLTESANHDLVVIASHGRSGFKRLLLGSIAESVIRHTPCSVYVHRRHEEKA